MGFYSKCEEKQKRSKFLNECSCICTFGSNKKEVFYFMTLLCTRGLFYQRRSRLDDPVVVRVMSEVGGRRCCHPAPRAAGTHTSRRQLMLTAQSHCNTHSSSLPEAFCPFFSVLWQCLGHLGTLKMCYLHSSRQKLEVDVIEWLFELL